MSSNEQHEHHESSGRIVYKTPPKMAFLMGIMAGVTLASIVGFGMMYSIANPSDGAVAATNSNTAKVAGVVPGCAGAGCAGAGSAAGGVSAAGAGAGSAGAGAGSAAGAGAAGSAGAAAGAAS